MPWLAAQPQRWEPCVAACAPKTRASTCACGAENVRTHRLAAPRTTRYSRMAPSEDLRTPASRVRDDLIAAEEVHRHPVDSRLAEWSREADETACRANVFGMTRKPRPDHAATQTTSLPRFVGVDAIVRRVTPRD